MVTIRTDLSLNPVLILAKRSPLASLTGGRLAEGLEPEGGGGGGPPLPPEDTGGGGGGAGPPVSRKYILINKWLIN